MRSLLAQNPRWKVVVMALSVVVLAVCAVACVLAENSASSVNAQREAQQATVASGLYDTVTPASKLAADLARAWDTHDTQAASPLLAMSSSSYTSPTTQSDVNVHWLGGAVVSGDKVSLRFVSLSDGAIDTVIYGSTTKDGSVATIDSVATTSGVKAGVTGVDHDEIVDKTNEVMDMVRQLRETQGEAPTMDPSDMDAITSARIQARAQAESGAQNV